eukprot:200205_1
MAALSYYQQLSLTQPQKFIDFCDKYYPKEYSPDYIHCISIHKNDMNKDEIENEKTCTMVSSCVSTTRHYRDRSVKDNNNNIQTSYLYFDIFDTFHFYIYHMTECG